jgi:hypothetical protein
MRIDWQEFFSGQQSATHWGFRAKDYLPTEPGSCSAGRRCAISSCSGGA